MKYKSVITIRQLRAGLVALLLAACIPFDSVSHAAGEITSVVTSLKTANPLQYQVAGESYSWGEGDDQIIDGFVYQGHTYRYLRVAAEVRLQRVDRPGLTSGDPCGVFAQRTHNGFQSLAPSYPGSLSGNGNCDMAAMMASRVINRGTLDTFSNTGPNPKNIERIDFVFPAGIFTPVTPGQLAATGHIVAEKRGNNPVQIAAIIELDEEGEPARYGPLVMVHSHGCSDPQICYGITAEMHDYSFFQSPANVPVVTNADEHGSAYATYTGESTEHLGMAFVSVDDLGLRAAQTYYGFSYFPRDVDASQHNLLDPFSFPSDTADDYITPADGADIYGGVSAYFLLGSAALTTVNVFLDQNGNAIQDPDETGLSDISVNLYNDTNSNGVLDGEDTNVGQTLVTGQDGSINIAALPEGNYVLLLDENDPDIPAGLELSPGGNPLVFAETGGSQNELQFTFVQSTTPIQNDGGSDPNLGSNSAGESDGNGDAGGNGSGSGSAGDGTDGNTSGTTGSSGGGFSDSGSSDSGSTDGSGDGATGGNGDGSTDGTTNGTDDGGTGSDGNTDSNTDGNTDGSVGSAIPIATPDVATGHQNMVVTIDVLQNDVDPVGGGLTIVSVSSVEHGEAQIVGNTIVFQPDYDFLGQENFVYTIEDANGQMASGTVSVNVVRYSDINNNDINDYDECQCSDLRLITGVDGSGVGTLSMSTLLLLMIAWLGYTRMGMLMRVFGRLPYLRRRYQSPGEVAGE